MFLTSQLIDYYNRGEVRWGLESISKFHRRGVLAYNHSYGGCEKARVCNLIVNANFIFAH
jgi:hypothetical protein